MELAGLPLSHHAGTSSPHYCVTHRNDKNIVPIYCDSDDSTTVWTSRHFIFGSLAEDYCLSAYPNTSMSNIMDTTVLCAIIPFWF